MGIYLLHPIFNGGLEESIQWYLYPTQGFVT
jgi:hypothetical protein